eukprot:TRINITY_DN20081_c0_g2_i2.p3 TRINITY_DN20081_c0_g2~~TRINITY_DN20081_c0_g2_i2.p3  ORF type:complete len:216 (+),score=67.62 TRINITY_DN20081_c0_g2_i2:316-963(+)
MSTAIQAAASGDEAAYDEDFMAADTSSEGDSGEYGDGDEAGSSYLATPSSRQGKQAAATQQRSASAESFDLDADLDSADFEPGGFEAESLSGSLQEAPLQRSPSTAPYRSPSPAPQRSPSPAPHQRAGGLSGDSYDDMDDEYSQDGSYADDADEAGTVEADGSYDGDSAYNEDADRARDSRGGYSSEESFAMSNILRQGQEQAMEDTGDSLESLE